jgi:hypothetical protein
MVVPGTADSPFCASGLTPAGAARASVLEHKKEGRCPWMVTRMLANSEEMEGTQEI